MQQRFLARFGQVSATVKTNIKCNNNITVVAPATQPKLQSGPDRMLYPALSTVSTEEAPPYNGHLEITGGSPVTRQPQCLVRGALPASLMTRKPFTVVPRNEATCTPV